MEYDSKQIYTRFCQLKKEISALQKELRRIQPQVDGLMEEIQLKSKKTTVQVKSKEFSPYVIEYKTTTRKKTLNPCLVGDYLSTYLEENPKITLENVNDFISFLKESLVSDAVEGHRLSFKKQTAKKEATPREENVSPSRGFIDNSTAPDIIRY